MLKQILTVWLSMSVGALVMGLVGWAQLGAAPVLVLPRDVTGCTDDMVRVGSVCIDKYEASVWDSPAGTGTQYGAPSDDYPCSDNGNDCSDPGQAAKKIFAVSQAAATPSTRITWFQAGQACANVGKRLPTNAEWQLAAAGTPDPGTDDGVNDCNITTTGVVSLTGARANCVSNWGSFDMVGNVSEWVGDWMQDNSDSDGGNTSTATYGLDDIVGIDEAGVETDRFPAALFRGGNFFDNTGAGVFSVLGNAAPSNAGGRFGFRCAR